jgi:hypothetical protein
MPGPGRTSGPPLWAWFALRLLAIFVAGLALIVLFGEFVAPILRSEAERIQQEHHTPAESNPGRP